MVEKEETQEEQQELADDNSKDGDKSEVDRKIDDANLAAKRMEEATEALKKENNRRAEHMALQKIGGRTDAGMQEEKPKEIDNREYAKRALAGEFNEKKQ